MRNTTLIEQVDPCERGALERALASCRTGRQWLHGVSGKRYGTSVLVLILRTRLPFNAWLDFFTDLPTEFLY